MPKIKPIILDLGVFPEVVVVYYGVELDSFMRILSEVDAQAVSQINLNDLDVGGLMLPTSEGIVIWLRESPQKAHSIAALVHEAVHAAMYVHKKLGLSVKYDNDEALAYMIDFIVEGVLATL